MNEMLREARMWASGRMKTVVIIYDGVSLDVSLGNLDLNLGPVCGEPSRNAATIYYAPTTC